MLYANLIVDNNTDATDSLYTYKTDLTDLRPGIRVRVPFSVHSRMTDAFVVSLSKEPPEGVKRFKSISSLSEKPSLGEEAMETALWLKKRFLCRYIEAVRLFLPGGSEAKRKIKDPFENLEEIPENPPELTKEQKPAVLEISSAIRKKSQKSFLLFGVTGSGKTEVYLRAVSEALLSGRSAIVLVPEISLTPQTVSRFVNRFGKNSVAVLHSRLTPAQRAAEYKKIETGEVKVAVGARSAVFAPFKDIGVIIADEEHETSYKSDKAPKYDALEVAFKRTMVHRAVLILGSATPSVASYYRSTVGIYKRIELKERYNATPLPQIEIIDMGKELRSGNTGIFSKRLFEAAKAELSEGRQVILFLNRRGYSSFVSCRSCGYVVKCPECGISMVYHKEEDRCVCHYCGRSAPLPSSCPECGSRAIGRFGFGTEQVEEKARELFPGASIERLDSDFVKRKGALEGVLRRFAAKKTDILVGTQIVAKGLDFANVGLVGVMSADVTLNIPDYRSSERTFQLLTQAGGRAGRGKKRGLVIIQTHLPDESAVKCAAQNDYESFYKKEAEIRRATGYPPFGDIYRLVVSDESAKKAELFARASARWLKARSNARFSVLGPVETALKKADGLYRYQVLIKAASEERKAVSALISDLRKVFSKDASPPKLFTADVNPYSMM